MFLIIWWWKFKANFLLLLFSGSLTCNYLSSLLESLQAGQPTCLLFPHHQCTLECLEAEGFHQKLVLASASYCPAVAGGSISGPNPLFFQAGEGVGCWLRSAGNELIADGGWVDGEVIVYNRFTSKAVCSLIPLHKCMS